MRIGILAQRLATTTHAIRFYQNQGLLPRAHRGQNVRAAIEEKRAELRRRFDEMAYLDQRLAHLSGQLDAGRAPRPLIVAGKEEVDAVV